MNIKDHTQEMDQLTLMEILFWRKGRATGELALSF